MLEWSDDLKICDCGLYLDSCTPRALCFISHAHSDHIAIHNSAIATPATAAFAQHRLGTQSVTELEFDRVHRLDAQTEITLLSAGHILGSAMLHLRRAEGSLLYTGDFKLRSSLTVPPATPVKADALVMESTFGQPLFRFPPWQEVAAQLVELVSDALRAGRQPIVMGYSLGKAQEIVRILSDAGLTVTCHGAIVSMNGIYERFGVPVGTVRRYRFEDFHGEGALDLQQRGVLVAPPQVARTPFVTRFKNPCRIMMSGWSLLKNAIYRYGVDHALPLSDHADFDELMELIERVEPKKIYTHHGYREFVDILKSRGHDAELARPDEQLLLFPD
jgi:Cft2 family RNA processing exonuclease